MADVSIEFEHVLGRRILSTSARSVEAVLAQHSIPSTMVQVYLVRGEALSPVPSWINLDEVPGDVDRILVRALRNTLFDTILPSGDSGGALAEGVAGFGTIGMTEDGRAIYHHAAVNPETAQEVVTDQVRAFATEHRTAENGCVFAVSGGGDSNALAYGLRGALPGGRLSAFTLVFGDVMAQSAADRASVLCQGLEIEHRTYLPAHIAKLLGMRTTIDDLYRDFRGAFGQEALHFFGTFLILRCARRIGADRDFTDLAFGYNREDLLAELLFQLMNGRRPLAYPIRPIGAQRIVMPVWRTPKLLLDACNPAFSLENYRERDPHTTRERSLTFYLGHSLDSAYPAFGLSLLEGCRKTFSDSFGHLNYNSELDLFVTDDATTERLERVAHVLRNHLGSGE